jgi:hypothetical protein
LTSLRDKRLVTTIKDWVLTLAHSNTRAQK